MVGSDSLMVAELGMRASVEVLHLLCMLQEIFWRSLVVAVVLLLVLRLEALIP
jgi:hypothetical protein